jgi:DNA repair exonuclease SbcCD ATPase subunit
MNTLLTEWTIDFRIKTEEGLKFIVEFNDGRVLPAEALSGGEMIIFALAWRLAVHFRFASDIGLLCLDEPTVWLDKGRLECLKLAIEKMRSMANTSGLQCLLITHELELLNSMDKVIDLSKGTI